MSHIKLPSPARNEVEESPSLYPFKVENEVNLEVPVQPLTGSFDSVLSTRRSRREGCAPDREDISSLLWHCAKTKEISIEESGFQWEHRNSPSGGGRHPINIFVTNLQGTREGLHLYDSLTHSLLKLDDIDPADLQSFTSKVDEVLPLNNGCIVWFAAQFDKTLSKYQGGESLVWLDAGCLLATTYMVAEALGLNCCAIGITGEPYISRMLCAAPLIEGVAGCLIWKKGEGQ